MTISEPGGHPSSPKPAPRPDRRVRPRPGRPAPTIAAPPSSDPHRFGRVDPDGTVWLITGSGERVIGSWQAGDTEAAYAHFGRRFDDLHTEVALMESRLESGTGDARKIKAAATALAETLADAHVLGDVDALAARLATIAEHADEHAHADKAKREEHRAAQIARKEALAIEAEELAANSTQWKVAGDRCAKSSMSGAPSPVWTANPTTRCGSGTPRPARRSIAGAVRISRTSTASVPAPGRPRTICERAEAWRTRRTGGRRAQRSATS